MNNPVLRVFIDTNILMDLLFRREPFVKSAQTLFWLAQNKHILLLLSPTSFINADYVAKRYGYSHEQMREVLCKIEQLVIIPSTGQQQLQNALNSQVRDFEDATQIECALAGQADVIVTRNLQDFISSTIPCYVPDEFLLQHPELM